ncbi:MAG: sorbitol dehydrogenase [Gemmatales bacterium]|nr:MAG: sorbitol dehydrogenase [Gemmatales bacterium]
MSQRLHRCAFLVEPGRIEIREVPLPVPAAGEVLLRIDCALAGGTDLKAYLRGHPQIPMPGPFGHRYSGTVVQLGPGAPPFEIGQPVMGVHSAPCGQCPLCRKQKEHLCPYVMRDKVLGAFADYLCIPKAVAAHNLFERPASLAAEHAALLEPVSCVVHGLNLLAWDRVERVLVLGCGTMGLLFLQLLPRFTTAQRFAAGRRTARLQLAKPFAVDVWDVTSVSLAERLPATERFDCVIECTGKLDGWQEAFARTAPGGQVLLFGGLPKGTIFEVDSYRAHYEEVAILGSFHFTPRDVLQAREMLLAGEVRVDGLISDSFPLTRLEEALLSLKDGRGLQYAIVPG